MRIEALLVLTLALTACAPQATPPAPIPVDSSATLTRIPSGGVALYAGLTGVKSSVLEVKGTGLQVNPKAPCVGNTEALTCKFGLLEAGKTLTVPLRGVISSGEAVLEHPDGRTRVTLSK